MQITEACYGWEYEVKTGWQTSPMTLSCIVRSFYGRRHYVFVNQRTGRIVTLKSTKRVLCIVGK